MKKSLSVIWMLVMLIGLLPQVALVAHAAEVPVYLELAPDDYSSVSNDSAEKLACGPGMVTFGDGYFAVAYLADEVNTVETEASTTIVCRLGIFHISDPESGTFLDIATSGQTIGDVTIGNKAPYEPNLLQLSDEALIVFFNIRDTSGRYIYYSARYNTKTHAIESYDPLTLDGREWTPANVATSYNAIADNSISTSGPTGSMVFTSKIVEHDGWFYGYCGGICAGFSGMLVRSCDGINWESVLAPEALSEMKGVIECGFEFLDNHVYFCMRDISSGIYHCSYRFSDETQVVGAQKLAGLTTSKPTAFLQDGEMYLIVNALTGDEATVARRNTALFYKVDPQTCSLQLVKHVFCGDGCAYHTVVQYNGTNYWCFHTDARRINPYTQGRSNLAFLEVPPFAEMDPAGNVLELERYAYCFGSGCITSANNTWQAGAVNTHYQIPLAAYQSYKNVTITASEENKCYIAFVTEKMTTSRQIPYAEGWTEQLIMDPCTTQTLEIPSDATYLYILATNAAGDSMLPSVVEFQLTLEHDYEAVVTDPTCTEQGYTTYTCECGDSYVADYVDAVREHSYDNGVCIWCGRSVLGTDWIAPDFAEGDYTMVALPDTQILVQYWPEIYYNQMQWIADNKDTLNIQAVLHMGDMVNNNNDTEWTVCEVGTDTLNASGIPWMPMMGNHDNSVWFNRYYDYATYGTDRSWFGGSYHADKLDHTYWFVNVGDREYMILSLGWAPSWDVLDWAQGIVEAYSDKSVILVDHAYMNKDGTLLSKGDAPCVSQYLPGYPDGDDVWNIFKEYENMVLAMGGHIHSADLVTYVDKNGSGQDVTSLLVDRQNDDIQNRYAMVAVLTFHSDSDRVDVNWYSTRYDAMYKAKNQFSITVPDVCEHSFISEVTDATCTQGGGTTYTCTNCGYSYLDASTSPLDHKYEVVTVEPSCMTAGYTESICSVCGHTERALLPNDITNQFKWNEGYVISALNGNMMENPNWVASDYVDISAFDSIEIVTGDTVNANTTLGIAFYDASQKYISGAVHTDKTGNEYGILVHNLIVPENAVYARTTWYSVNHEKYDGAALHTFYCKGYSAETPPLGHNFVETVTPPTCTEYGYTTMTCIRCGKSEVKTNGIDISNRFVWQDQKMIIATTGELRDYSVWKASEFTDISDYDKLIIKTANTANVSTSTGFAFYDADKNYISGVIHTNGSGVYGVLIHDLEIPENAVYIRTTWYSKNHPNYNESFGSFCCEGVCTIVPALGHHYKTAVTEPTCTEQGYTTYTCACGDSYVDDYADASGEHSYGDWAQIVAPTCDVEGQDKRICDGCGDEQYRDTRISGDPNKIQVSNPVDPDYYAGKKIVFLGDSVTYGAFIDTVSTDAYPYVLCDSLGATVSNRATSGSSLCTGGHVTANSKLTEANIKGADVVTILLGVNDFNHAVKDGIYQGTLQYDPSASYYDLGDYNSTDTSEYYGALRAWCEKIVDFKAMPEFENTEFIFITMPITARNRSVTKNDTWDQTKTNIFGHTLRAYCTAVMEICAEYDIPVFDANMYSGIYYNSPDDNNAELVGGSDGIHPTAAGHALIAEALEEFLLEGYSYETRAVADCGHSYENGACKDCHLPSSHQHTYVNGICTSCGAEAPHCHSYESTITVPTCTEQGYTTYTCRCGDSYAADYVPAMGHSEVTDNVVAATCTESGLSEGKHCSACGEVLAAQQVIPAKGHVEVTNKAVAATCTESGLSEGKHCSVCGEVLLTQQEIPAAGHSEVIDAAVTPTCTASGLSEGKHCGECGVVLVAQYVIPAKGHNFANGVCSSCRAADPDYKPEIPDVLAKVSVSADVTRGAEVMFGGETKTSDGKVSFSAEKGTYTLTAKQKGCLTYTVKNVAVGEKNIDLGKIELLAGDVNGDDMINIMDMGAFRQNFGKVGGNIANKLTDVNGDNMVNIMDMGTFRANFGKTAAKDCTFTYNA